jgi:hypothetical protein
MLAGNPADRPGSAQEVAERLEALEQELDGLADTAERKAPATPRASAAAPPGRVRQARWRALLALGLLALVVPLGWMYGGVVVHFATNQGTLVVRVDDPDVEVSIKRNGAVVRDPSTKREFVLTAGKGEVEVLEKGSGKKLATKRFTLSRGGKVTVTVELVKPPAVDAPGDVNRRAAEWVLSAGGSVTVRVEGKQQRLADASKLPAGPFALVGVDLRQKKRIGDADLTRLRGLNDLLDLNLKGTRVTDAGMAHLAGPGKLKVLTLSATRVGDAGLAHLTGLKTLEAIKLADTQTSDAGLKHLKGLSRLVHLDLRRTALSDDGVAVLKGLKRLGELNLSHTRVGDAALLHLAGLSELTFLGLSETRVSDVGLGRLAAFKRLRALALARTPISDAGLVHLQKLTQLRSLDLTGTRVTAAAIADLQKALPGCKVQSSAKQK